MFYEENKLMFSMQMCYYKIIAIPLASHKNDLIMNPWVILNNLKEQITCHRSNREQFN